MTGPSAIGSLYGMPTSHRWQPRPITSFSTAAVNARSGSPAVTNGISALRFSRRRFENSLSICRHDVRRYVSSAELELA